MKLLVENDIVQVEDKLYKVKFVNTNQYHKRAYMRPMLKLLTKEDLLKLLNEVSNGRFK